MGRVKAKRLPSGALLLVLVAVASCGRSVPQLHPLAPGAVILAFGDSITFGTGADPAESYPAILQELTGHTVINAGVPGEVSRDGLQRLPEVLDEPAPGLVILCHGGNDLLGNEPEERLEENLRAMGGLARSRGIPVVIVAVPEPGLIMRPPRCYERVASDLGVPIETEVLQRIERDTNLKSDLVHPNREGYRLMAKAIFDLLKRSGAL